MSSKLTRLVGVFFAAAVALIFVGCGSVDTCKINPASPSCGSQVVDTDKDGTPDSSDNCPTVAGPAANNGCPWPPVTITKTTIASYSPADGSSLKYAQYGGSAAVVVSWETPDSVPCPHNGCAIEVDLYNEYGQTVGVGLLQPDYDSDLHHGTVGINVAVPESPYWPNGIKSVSMKSFLRLNDVVTGVWSQPDQVMDQKDVTWYWNK